MYVQENKSNEHSRKTDVNSIIQKKINGKTMCRFNDNRPRSILQKKLSRISDEKPQLEQPSALPHIPDNRPLTPVQRVVRKSTAPWGPTKGLWITTLDTSVGYNTEEEAESAEIDIINKQVQKEEDEWKTEEQKIAWIFKDADGRLTTHFEDGWGAAYGITSYNDLGTYIENSTNEELEGDNIINLGQYQNSDEHISKHCDIRYNVSLISLTVGPITRLAVIREVYHCGPAST